MSRVAILGASSKIDRYANKAQRMLTEYGHIVLPVSSKEESIMGVTTYQSLNDIKEPVDTLTLYINPERLQSEVASILALKPRRVIFNPGTESSEIERTLKENGIHVVEACTLVLLKTNQFDDA